MTSFGEFRQRSSPRFIIVITGTGIFYDVRPAYSDLTYLPSGKDRPNPRTISNNVLAGPSGLPSFVNRTALFAFFGTYYDSVCTNLFINFHVLDLVFVRPALNVSFPDNSYHFIGSVFISLVIRLALSHIIKNFVTPLGQFSLIQTCANKQTQLHTHLRGFVYARTIAYVK